MLLVGMDTPQVTPELLGADWSGHDAVLGLTEDGGYWCLGLREPDRRALVGVPMSTDHTGADAIVLRSANGRRSRPLPWARVGSRAIIRHARAAGLLATEDWRADGRAFLTFRRSPAATAERDSWAQAPAVW